MIAGHLAKFQKPIAKKNLQEALKLEKAKNYQKRKALKVKLLLV